MISVIGEWPKQLAVKGAASEDAKTDSGRACSCISACASLLHKSTTRNVVPLVWTSSRCVVARTMQKTRSIPCFGLCGRPGRIHPQHCRIFGVGNVCSRPGDERYVRSSPTSNICARRSASLEVLRIGQPGTAAGRKTTWARVRGYSGARCAGPAKGFARCDATCARRCRRVVGRRRTCALPEDLRHRGPATQKWPSRQ